MKLANCENAVVDQTKVTDYLLNPKHPYGASKAQFFTGFGFCIERWEEMAELLKEHGGSHEISTMRETGFGLRYSVDGELNAPDGRHPNIRTVWQMDEGTVVPRLITAYPLETKL